MNKLFLISSTAGATEYYFSKEEIEEVYKNHGRLDEIRVEETSYKGHLEEIVTDFISNTPNPKAIIVLGGDGSINEVVNLCVGHNVAVGLIPTGTGNDFAKNFDYSNFKIEDTFDTNIKPIDLIRVNGRYCVNATSLGFDTEVLERAYYYLDKNKSYGKRAYIKAVADKIKSLSYQDLEMELDLADGSRVNISDEFLITALCNGSYYGSGFNPAPDAKIDDGIINLILAYKFPKYALLPLILKYKKGKHQSSPYLREYKVKSGVIRSSKTFLANNDGMIFKADTLAFEVIPSAIGWVYFKNIQ